MAEENIYDMSLHGFESHIALHFFLQNPTPFHRLRNRNGEKTAQGGRR